MSISATVLRFGRWTNRSAETIDREIDEELDFHVECRTRDLIKSGMSPEHAAEEASRQFGVRDRIRRECQTIGYGLNVWLIIALSGGILVSLATIGWMGWLLNSANQQNQQMLAMVNAQQPASDPKSDLNGEVKDDKDQPVSGARVLLIFKSWPGGQYQQESFVQTADEKGKFRFPELYSPVMQNAFLVTVLSEGRTMQSEYVVYKAKAKVKPFRFNLQTAVEKTLIVHDTSGKPMADAVVFPSLRKPAKGPDEHMMYDQSAEAAGFKTDAEGKVKMALFAVGDAVQLGIVGAEPIELVIDKAAEQKIGAGMSAAAASATGIHGTVMDATGKPVADAKVLLILKTWPGGRFQQQPSETTTNAEGRFAFPVGNHLDGKEAFLVTVVAEGLAFQSRYVMKNAGKQTDPLAFELSAATEKTIVIRDSAGKPLAEVVVALSSRKEDKSDEHMIYGVSFPSVSYKTDSDGKVALNFFAVGDTAKLSLETSEGSQEIEFNVNDKPEQAIDVKKKVNRP